ncbi:MAG: signal peptidase I [Lachnospiraceae bacterium]|nr:signal peptidase I [Lachnospiraceae bacterium]
MTDKKEEKEEKKEKKREHSAIKELISWIEVFAAAIIAALFINSFIIANSTVPSGSMENTIEQKDRVIGSRLSYTFGDPERGDIAIFKFGWICNRCNRAQGEGEAPDICPKCGQEITRPKTLYYLKRVIGVPGDKIEIRQDGTVKQNELDGIEGLDPSKGDDAELITAAVYLNGEKLDESYLKEPMLYTGDMDFEVPDDCYFMMGDNRNNSLDARYWNEPYINKDKMVAKVMFRYFPNPSTVK